MKDNEVDGKYLRYIFDEGDKIIKKEDYDDQLDYERAKLQYASDMLSNINVLFRNEKIEKIKRKMNENNTNN